MTVFPVVLISDCLLIGIIRHALCSVDSNTEGPGISKERTYTERVKPAVQQEDTASSESGGVKSNTPQILQAAPNPENCSSQDGRRTRGCGIYRRVRT